jgi:hypothetical protein
MRIERVTRPGDSTVFSLPTTHCHPAAAAAAARQASRPVSADACWRGLCGHTEMRQCNLAALPEKSDLGRGRDARWMQSAARVALAGR